MHKLLTDEPGKKMLLLGNEAIARGAIVELLPDRYVLDEIQRYWL